MKFLCNCGETIRDQSDHLLNKAYFVNDLDYENYIDTITNDITRYIEAIRKNTEYNWLEKYFNKKYPKNLKVTEIISDIISRSEMKYRLNIYQCEKCGRVYFEKKDSNSFYKFKPEEKQDNIFDKKTK